jgi:hypothetical protein
MKRASLIAAVLLLQLSYFPLVAQASPEEKAVGKAAVFYRHLNIARGIYMSAPSQVVSTSEKPAGQGESPQLSRSEPVSTNPAQSALAR